MEKINLVDILKDCPSGMELDCTMFDNVTFDGISNGRTIVAIRRTVNHKLYLDKYGCPLEHPKEDLKCVIFPKGKTTWEGFVPPHEFADGDIVYVKTKGHNHNEYIIIFKEIRNDHIHKYACFSYQHLSLDKCALCHLVDAKIMRLATEEEKKKLFDAIKDNGYKWNAETKTLEKLPKFKVGDRIQWYGTHITQPIRVVKSLECDRYRLDNGNYIKFGDEHAYKLLKFDKFDITTLKPFDKVLIRDNKEQKWFISFFGHYNNGLQRYKYCCVNDSRYAQCIPYEGNERLLDTTDDCSEFYKTWEE